MSAASPSLDCDGFSATMFEWSAGYVPLVPRLQSAGDVLLSTCPALVVAERERRAPTVAHSLGNVDP